LVNAIAVLIIACRARWVLPPDVRDGRCRRGAAAGVLIKNAEALEVMERVDTLVLDKTGTLTEGKPKVVAIVPNDLPGSGGKNELLRLAASVERGSEHPLAAAILQAAGQRGLELAPASEFKSHTGRGVTATVDGRKVALGNLKLIEELHLDAGDARARADGLRAGGQTAMFVAVDGRVAGLIVVADPIKSSTPSAIQALHADGVRIMMVTGDSSTTAQAVREETRSG
jgi:Cu+-exporting ATPase